jgi:hypothetical protein
MMLPMRHLTVLLLSATAGLYGCAGVAPDAAQMAASEPPAAGSPAAQAAGARWAAEAAQRASRADWRAAAAAAEEGLDEDPRNARALAVAALATLRIAPQDPVPFAVQQRADGQTALAVRLAPADPLVARLRGETLAAIGHLSAAAAAADAGLAAGPVSPVGDAEELTALLRAAATWSYELGEDRRAITHLEQLAVRDPQDALAHYRLGWCLLRTATAGDEAERAARAFQRAVLLSPTDEEAGAAALAAISRAVELDRKAAKSDDLEPRRKRLYDLAMAHQTGFPESAAAAFAAGCALAAAADGDAAHASGQDSFREALRRDPDHLPSALRMVDLAVTVYALYAEAPIPPPRELFPGAWIERALAIDERRGGLDEGQRARLLELASRWR